MAKQNLRNELELPYFFKSLESRNPHPSPIKGEVLRFKQCSSQSQGMTCLLSQMPDKFP